MIFLFMDGGPSQVDTFDPKPRLDREHGQPIKVKTHPTQFNNVGNVLACPWKFRRYGESGIPVSDLFPRVGQCVDDMAIVRSMVSNFSEHTNANYFLHTGNGLQGRPSQGAWVTYGLGSECQDLPAFVVLNGGLIPPGRHGLLQQRVLARNLPRFCLPAECHAGGEHHANRVDLGATGPQAGAAPQARSRGAGANGSPRWSRSGDRQL